MTRPRTVAAILPAALAAAVLTTAGTAAARPAATHPAAAAHRVAAAVAPLRAWGANDNGQLGNGTLLTASRPVKVKLPKGVTITQVRAGCSDTVALTSTGRVYAWGQNTKGQLGDGTTATRTVPVRVKLPAGIKATAVRAGCRDKPGR